MPGYWMHETGGTLRPAIEAFLSGAALTDEQMVTLRAYLDQWMDGPWKPEDIVLWLRSRIPDLASNHDVRVELHSVVTGEVTELARMQICNRGDGSAQHRNYEGHTLTGRSGTSLDRSQDRGTWTRRGTVERHLSQRLHVWHLVAKMLASMSYGAADAR